MKAATRNSLLFALRRALTPLSLLVCVPVVAQRGVEDQLPRTVEVPRAIVRQLASGEEREDLLILKDGRAENLVAQYVELNGDGPAELIVHGINSAICGAANCVHWICGAANCVHWIYRRTAKGYQLLLDAGAVQQITPQKTFTNGYRDVVTSMHGSAFDSDLTLYKFDGKQYQMRRCFYRTYRSRDKAGRFHDLKRPIITPVKCSR